MCFAKLVEGFCDFSFCTGKLVAYGELSNFCVLAGLLYGLSLLSGPFFFVTCYEIMILNILQYEMEILIIFFLFLPECVTHKFSFLIR